jgi:iron complex transport system substrate-binding protein
MATKWGLMTRCSDDVLAASRRIGLRRAALGLLCVVALAMLWPLPALAVRLVVDSAGRHIEVPDRIERVIAAGPPASVLMTILAPEKLIGWNRKPAPEDLSSCGRA